MIAATIHDPSLFASLGDVPADRRAMLVDHLGHVAHSHLTVLDRQRILGEALLRAISFLSPQLQKRAEVAMTKWRVVTLRVSPEKVARYRDLIERTETAYALSINQDGIDALITDEDGKACSEALDGEERKNVYTLTEFLGCAPHQRLLETMGGVSTGGMEQVDFGKKIIEPVVRWAKNVRIYDRYICAAWYENDPQNPETHSPQDSENGTQWSRTKATLQFLYKEWENATVTKDKDAFIIVTQPIIKRRWGGERTPWQIGNCPSYKAQAQTLAEELELGQYARILLLGVPAELRDLQHDRYLVTNQEVILTFSRGFDLIRPDRKLYESTISLYQRGSGDSVLSLLNGARILTECRLELDGWMAT